MITRHELFKELPVVLTDKERHEHLQNLLKAMDRVNELEEEKKAVSKQIAGSISEQNDIMIECRKVLRRGTLPREVKCEQVFNYNEGIVYIVRLDTAEVISSRPMTPNERQQGLEFEPTKTLAELNQERLEAEWEEWIRAEAEEAGEDPDKAWEAELEAKSDKVVPLRGKEAAGG